MRNPPWPVIDSISRMLTLLSSGKPFHPEEITELYLGAAMTDADKQEIIATAKALNPEIAVFQAKQDQEGRISFDRV
ncbi:hypothetical protein [Bradyrhizobium sp. STM 3561]|uniref:hypothetical protein n=1 Tax=Bradyrhizobium sp. STM 3561 TaxID=578923 RepID=UPI00388E5C13